VDVKTEQAKRAIVLMPALARMLREHKLASRHSGPLDFVFTSSTGGPLHYRNTVRRGFEPACRAAGIEGLRWHDLRHTYASLLVEQGEDVAWLSRQLGHARPSITLDVYTHLFDQARHAEQARGRLEAGYGDLLDGALLDRARERIEEQTDLAPGVPEAPAPLAEVAQLRGSGTQGK
jgi:integrase